MKSSSILLLAGTLLVCGPYTKAQAGAQASSSTSSTASVQADKSGAQASSSTSTSTSAQTGKSSAALSSGSAVNAALTQPVDVKKNKPGDQVTAKTTDAVKSEGHVVIPKGAKLIGHVTECKQRGKEEKESALGIVFDKAILKNGEELPLNMTIRAIAAAQTATNASYAGDDLAAGGGVAGSSGRAATGGALGGVRSTAGATAGAVTNTAANAGGAAAGTLNSTANAAGAARGAVGGLNAAGQLASNSQGVFGLEGLNLNTAAASSTQGSMITSTSRNVHLDSGTQLLLVTQAQASAN